MTYAQSREFVLRELTARHPVFFSEESLKYILSHKGKVEGKFIMWQGWTYEIVKVHETTRIVETVLKRGRPLSPYQAPVVISLGECNGLPIQSVLQLANLDDYRQDRMEIVSNAMQMVRHNQQRMMQKAQRLASLGLASCKSLFLNCQETVEQPQV